MSASFCSIAATAVLAVLLSGQSRASAAGADRDPQAAVQAAREALAGGPDYPWYDPQEDEIRRIDVRPPRDPAPHRTSTWEVRELPETQGTSAFAQYLWATLNWAFWALLTLLLVGLVIVLVRAYLRGQAGTGWDTSGDRAGDGRSEDDLIESLPFQVDRPRSDLLDEARRHYEQGRYGQAIVYLFSYQLVQLDRHHAIRLTRGKTNRQYLRELHGRPDLARILAATMVAFEDVFFGHHPLDRQSFEACWSKLEDFHRVLQPSS
jgi:hypothetical protein